jgi:hypothetical protein
MTGGPVDVTLLDGTTHLDEVSHTEVQAVLACVQEIYADEALTVQVIAAAVIAQHQLLQGHDPETVLQTLSDGLRGRMLPEAAW